MLKYDSFYFCCPSCKAWLEGRDSRAEVINEAILYSDGKTLYDNYITTRQKMIICPSCAHIFWIEDVVEPIITYNKPDADIYSWSSWRFYGVSFSDNKGKMALIQHYHNFLSRRNYDAAKEIYLRRFLWWAYNDLHRNHFQVKLKYWLDGTMSYDVWRQNRKMLMRGELLFQKNYDDFKKNLERLLQLLERHPEEANELEIPEIYRELRQFDKAKAYLDNHKDFSHYSEKMRLFVSWKYSRVFLVSG